MQLTAWLERHEGRPGMAQSSMEEQLLDIPVTASRKAEAEAYEVRLKRFRIRFNGIHTIRRCPHNKRH